MRSAAQEVYKNYATQVANCKAPRNPEKVGLDGNPVCMKVENPLLIALVDQQTVATNLISSQFVFLYKLPT